MYPVDKFLRHVWNMFPEATEQDAESLFREAVKQYHSDLEWIKDHPGNCHCPPCDWVHPPRSEDWHGTTNGYQYHKCRCDRCRKAANQYNKSRR